jgi:4-amino-4-deoxy-L-arabinose transferase-like glycosyltransferase
MRFARSASFHRLGRLMVQSLSTHGMAPFNALRLAGLLGAATILFGLGIGSYPLTDGDGAFYGRIARNVIEQDHGLVLRFDPDNTRPDVDKPPAGIWLLALSFRLLGRSELAARLPGVIISVGLVWLTAEFGRILFGSRAGYLAGAILTTIGQFFYQAREPLLDVPLVLCVTVALFLVVRFALGGRWAWFHGAWAVVGLGIMVKGPVAFVLTAFPALVFLASSSTVRGFSRRRWVVHTAAGAALAALLVLPWHVWAFAIDGRAFLDVYLGQVAWQRYLKPIYPPGAAIPMYAGFLLLGSLPWSGMTVAAVLACRRAFHEREVRFLLAWVATVVLFFGLSPGGALMRYVLPAFPALAMLTGRFLASAPAGWLRRGGLLTVLSGAMLLGAYVWIARSDIGRLGGGLVLGFVLMLGATLLVGGWLAMTSRVRSAIAVLLGGAAAAYVAAVSQAPATVERLYPQRAIASRVNQEAGSAARVATVRIGSADVTMLSFYLDGRVNDLADAAALGEFLDREPRAWVVEDAARPLPADVRARLAVVAEYPGRTLLRAGAIRGRPTVRRLGGVHSDDAMPISDVDPGGR